MAFWPWLFGYGKNKPYGYIPKKLTRDHFYRSGAVYWLMFLLLIGIYLFIVLYFDISRIWKILIGLVFGSILPSINDLFGTYETYLKDIERQRQMFPVKDDTDISDKSKTEDIQSK